MGMGMRPTVGAGLVDARCLNLLGVVLVPESVLLNTIFSGIFIT
jgi:hypothetical protein